MRLSIISAIIIKKQQDILHLGSASYFHRFLRFFSFLNLPARLAGTRQRRVFVESHRANTACGNTVEVPSRPTPWIRNLWQHRTIPALRLKHRSDGCGTASALPKCSIMSGCGTRIVLRGQKPLALCDRCPCFGSLHPPLAALTFAASSIICAFGLASAAPRSPYRHLELCGVALYLPPAPILPQPPHKNKTIKPSSQGAAGERAILF